MNHGPGKYYYITSTTAGAPEKVGLVSAQAPQVKVKGILRSFEASERKVAFEGGKKALGFA